MLFRSPPFFYSYAELKNVTEIYNADGSLKFDSGNCPENQEPQSLLEQAGCWLQVVESSLPGTTDLNIKNHLKICPSFKVGECAGANYKGSSLEVRLAWHAKQGECIGSQDDSICTYITRVEL